MSGDCGCAKCEELLQLYVDRSLTEAERREALFQDSVHAERTRGDALAQRFEEALRQAREEPISRPKRDFDWD